MVSHGAVWILDISWQVRYRLSCWPVVVLRPMKNIPAIDQFRIPDSKNDFYFAWEITSWPLFLTCPSNPATLINAIFGASVEKQKTMFFRRSVYHRNIIIFVWHLGYPSHIQRSTIAIVCIIYWAQWQGFTAFFCVEKDQRPRQIFKRLLGESANEA